MTMTWVMMAYYLYRCQFGEHEEVIVQTKKEVDADLNLIKKAVFMANSQPFWLMPENKYAYCRLRFPGTNSSMRGLAGGAGPATRLGLRTHLAASLTRAGSWRILKSAGRLIWHVVRT